MSKRPQSQNPKHVDAHPAQEIERDKHFVEITFKRFDAGDRAEATVNIKINYALAAFVTMFSLLLKDIVRLHQGKALIMSIGASMLLPAILLLLSSYFTASMQLGADARKLRDTPMSEQNIYLWTLTNLVATVEHNESVINSRSARLNLSLILLGGLVALWMATAALAIYDQATNTKTQECASEQKQPNNTAAAAITPNAATNNPGSGPNASAPSQRESADQQIRQPLDGDQEEGTRKKSDQEGVDGH